MAIFNAAYLLVADAEGGYQNHPSDTGNYNSLGQNVGTNLGISAKAYEDWINRPPSVADMRAITPAIAAEIYRRKYWDPILGDQIQSQQVANIFFDGRVNHGRTGVTLMQRVLGVNADGTVGPVTLAAINRANPSKLVNDYREARRAFYYQLVEGNPSYSAFLQGWLNRLATFSTSAVGLTGGFAVLAIAIYFLLQKK
jgi:lysozyme family protein